MKTFSEIREGSVITYDNENSCMIGTVRATRAGKYVILNEKGRLVELSQNRLFKLNSTIQFSTEKELSEKLATLRNKSLEKVDSDCCQVLWELLKDEEGEKSHKELCDIYFTETDIEQELGLRLRLIEDRIHFKRTPQGYSCRSEPVVEELTRAENIRKEKEEKKKLFTKLVLATLKGENEKIPLELHREVDLLIDLASIGEDLEQSRLKEARSLLEEIKGFVNWEKIKFPHSIGIADDAFALLMSLGIFKKHENLAVHKYKPKTTFSEQALDEARSICNKYNVQQNQAEGINKFLDIPIDVDDINGFLSSKGSRNFLTEEYHALPEELAVFTIDDSSTQDVDDGLSFEQVPGGFRIGIHITNVAKFLHELTTLKQEAQIRGTSIYCPDIVIHMLPESLSKQLCSILVGKPTFCLSLFIYLNNSNKILNWFFAQTIISSSYKLNYNQVDTVLEDSPDESIPDEIRYALKKLSEVFSKFEQERIENGANEFSRKEVVISPPRDELSPPRLSYIDMTSPARKLVAESMILFNYKIAKIAQSLQIPFPYRTQEAINDQDRDLQSSEKDSTTASEQTNSNRPQFKRSEVRTFPGSHSSLGLDVYSQASSPIRRYLDLLAQEQLIYFFKTNSILYSNDTLQNLIFEISHTISNANEISKESKRYWLLEYLRNEIQRNKRFESRIVKVIESKGYLVEINFLQLVTFVKSNKKLTANAEVTLEVQQVQTRSNYIRSQII
jgi:exoribonuclease II